MKIAIIMLIIALVIIDYASSSEILLDKKRVEIDLGDIRELDLNTVIEELTLVQTQASPKKVKINLKYHVPAYVCAHEEIPVIKYPNCNDNVSIHDDCSPYISYVCYHHIYDTDSRLNTKVLNQKNLTIKFKYKIKSEKKLKLTLTKTMDVKSQHQLGSYTYRYESMYPIIKLETTEHKLMKFKRRKLLDDQLFVFR